jgi:glycerol-3-phosphate dehydrogenase (NAD(P)+)
MKLAVLGAGNWGTVIAQLAAGNGHEVVLWTRNAAQRDEINERRTNEKAVPGLALHAGLRATTELGEALVGAELVIVVIPSQAIRQVAHAAGDFLRPHQVVLHATKGLEQGTRLRMTEILRQETSVKQVGVLAGPNIAGEIALGMPAGTVVTSRYPLAWELGRRALASRQMMVFHGDDVLGVELAGALKNVVAIAAGMASEMKVGENAKALLMTRGLAEITRIGVALGAAPSTFSGLAGMGDLIATCSSPRSRNHRVGAALVQGHTLSDILNKLQMVAEGVPTCVVARELARELGIDAPLIERVYRVVHEGLDPRAGLDELMHVPAGKDVSAFGGPRATAF